MLLKQNITTAKLKQALHLREQIEAAQKKLDAILGGKAATSSTKKKVGKRTMSAETIEKMRAAQQARWAKNKGSAGKS